MPNYTSIPKWLLISAQGGTIVSPPVAQKGIKLLQATDYNHTTVGIFPQSGLGNIVGGHFNLFVTGRPTSGGTGDVRLLVEGSDSLTDNVTQALTAFNLSATSFDVLDASLLSVGEYILLYDLLSVNNAPTVGNGPNTNQEWVKITNIVSNTLTVVRGVWGTFPVSWNNAPFVFSTTSWAPVATGNSATPFMDTDDIAISGTETPASPQIISLDMLALGMDSISYDFLRVKVIVSSGDTINGYLNAGLLFQTEQHISLGG